MTRLAAVEGVLIGEAVPFGPNGELSAINKQLVTCPWFAMPYGLDGDEHGDTVRHGGKDKALLHYPFDHYACWTREKPELAQLAERRGFFGENISTSGLTEADVCLGDVLHLGGAVVEITQSRQPCWKMNVRSGYSRMAAAMQETGRVGWYYRVLNVGFVSAGDDIQLLKRPYPAWPINRVARVLYEDTEDWAVAFELGQLPMIPESWRKMLSRRVEKHQVEDWSTRLIGPTDVAGRKATA